MRAECLLGSEMTCPETMKTYRLCSQAIVATALSACLCQVAFAEDVMRAPLPKDHPLVGTWRVEIPSLMCYEIYQIRTDGTSRVMSANERAESDFQIALQPTAKGFYRWVDKIVKDNGQPDCSGSVMQLGHVATNFVALHPSGDRFLLCDQEEFKSCLGPFTRVPDSSIGQSFDATDAAVPAPGTQPKR